MDKLTEQRKAYKSHQHGARARNIAFNLTFEQWWALWQPYWDKKQAWRLCMCRNGDAGAYELSNVRIDTDIRNKQEAGGKPRKRVNLMLVAPVGKSLTDRLARLEVRLILAALRICQHNLTATARYLGISFRQFRYALQKYNGTKRRRAPHSDAKLP